ncbi:MAG: hypothetical protein ACF8OB_03640 [Phycisphaeraceae bacterium JB051]
MFQVSWLSRLQLLVWVLLLYSLMSCEKQYTQRVIEYAPAEGYIEKQIAFEGKQHLIQYRRIEFETITSDFSWQPTATASAASAYLQLIATVMQQPNPTSEQYLALFHPDYLNEQKLKANLIEWEMASFNEYLDSLKSFYEGGKLLGEMVHEGVHVVVISIPSGEEGREPIVFGMPVIKLEQDYLLAPGAKVSRPFLQHCSKKKYAFMFED